MADTPTPKTATAAALAAQKEEATARAEAEAEMKAKTVAPESNQDMGEAPKPRMTKVPEPQYTDATLAEIEAGKAAATAYEARRQAELDMGARLSGRQGPVRPRTLPRIPE